MAVSPTADQKAVDKPFAPGAQEYTPRPAIWADVPQEKWDDWRWQLSNRLNTIEELSQVIDLTEEELEGLSAEGKFRVDITPYFASLLEPDPYGPVRMQVIPKGRELVPFDSMMADSLAEDAHSPVPGLVHRYPDRVLMLTTTQCASYCRYCTRSPCRSACWSICSRSSAKSRTSRSSVLARGCLSSCRSASPTSWSRCCASTTRFGSTSTLTTHERSRLN